MCQEFSYNKGIKLAIIVSTIIYTILVITSDTCNTNCPTSFMCLGKINESCDILVTSQYNDYETIISDKNLSISYNITIPYVNTDYRLKCYNKYNHVFTLQSKACIQLYDNECSVTISNVIWCIPSERKKTSMNIVIILIIINIVIIYNNNY